MSGHTRPAPSTELPHGRMAIWWFLASEVAIFGGLIMTYLVTRLAHPEWSAEAVNTVNWAGALNTMVLLTSSLIIVQAHKAAHDGEHEKAATKMLLTIACGFVFLAVKAYEYHHEITAGFTPMANLFWAYYFLMTGLHAAHVIAGMTAIFVVSRGVRRGENLHRVELVGMYWHLVDIVWIFLFPLLYLAS